MFGSNDDKKTPAAAGEKKGLFGWLRKKPQETVVEQPQVQPEPIPEPLIEAAPVAETPAPVVLPLAEPVLQPVVEAAPEPEPEHKPWPELPVAEEPVALVDDVQAEHVVPPIPPVIEPELQPVVVEPTPAAVPVQEVAPAVIAPAPAETSKTGFFARLKQGLSKTSASIGEGMASLFLGRKTIDDELLEDIETRLLTADVGVEATAVIIQSLTQKVARKQLTDADALYKSLQAELAAMLKPVEAPLVITPNKPFVILVVGVNGAGKTTTIGKLAKKLQSEGKKVMLAAGDTFRAAAVEQLQVWGERNKIPVIAQHTGADSASVIFDAVQAAKARNIDVLIADTAGRLHTKDNLMEELKKVRRVIGKLDADAPHEVLLVLDAGTGQNAISQAKQFNQTVQLTGLALTKLDGTAKGGVIFALAKQFGLPIRYIGVGEGIDDLRTFEAEPFVQALFAERERS
ncbi:MULTISPECIES: signal recognition particle-docking protein FtsY [Pseudomonas]|jgi:fused signal recognition particle receptor|uniref:signal recognition particle-docking protein FtsY n=1 Tax=Pseudomonas TaxID=286 RepID=UPI00054BF43C|nr:MULTISPECIES: signal recognition particle-docking protein FtsY [Pseudomonas]OXS23820.1 signal recognition particle-docking protein FtsY [Pseudomonas fluorescens]MBB4813579.1 fused signal recognition particle receptor [Pseudomonas rhodesiae]MDN6862203.1 signal recognition particle-docking protein FtsY [Pseudomonas rhodesiae]OZO50596.1 signal recognition particle-docking protein FtsY [Pseudomonas fluorescens]POA59536.1 signal recognition particle-docking protein FtsY [Pseudomonas sp. GW531-R1